MYIRICHGVRHRDLDWTLYFLSLYHASFLFLFLCFSLFLSFNITLSLSFLFSLSLFFSHSLYLFPSLSLTFSFFHFLSLSISFFLSFSLVLRLHCFQFPSVPTEKGGLSMTLKSIWWWGSYSNDLWTLGNALQFNSDPEI